MIWNPAEQKPRDYEEVLLAMVGGRHYTTGYWASGANMGKGAWIGLALNQSPPVYQLEKCLVKYWEAIEEPKEEAQP
jgi:hypothetical protein